MNIDQIQSILGAEIECGVFESVVVPALDVCRKVAASSAATVSDAARITGWLVRGKQTHLYFDSPNRPGFVVINGNDPVVSMEPHYAPASSAATTAGAQDERAPNCRACNGNDGDTPCAYPKGGQAGCLRDARLARAASSATTPLTSDSDAFLAEVRAELIRARAKFPGDRIMTIALAEEFGELCKAVLDECSANVRKEAVQTAVMCARVVLDGDGSVNDWRAERGLDPLVIAQSTNGEQS